MRDTDVQTVSIEAASLYFRTLQGRILNALETFDGRVFRRDAWSRRGDDDASGLTSGEGVTALVEGRGFFFERAAVNFSDVMGKTLPSSATAKRPELAGLPYRATGLSLVVHPENPHCPTAHMNIRCFAVFRPETSPLWWFGGGMDLTPFYPVEQDVRHFHQQCRAAVMLHLGEEGYRECKTACDRYFFLKHRNEARGVGGLFFDDLGEARLPFENAFALTRSVGEAFVSAYLPIAKARRHEEYGERERAFQAYRRARYVEFNLVHDRGTLFGLHSGGRTESILVSMPPMATWRYDWHPEPGSPEAQLYTDFLIPRDWV
jgi:coproporphyrinogen III oxidase